MSDQVYANDSTTYGQVLPRIPVASTLGGPFAPAIPFNYIYTLSNNVVTLAFDSFVANTQLNSTIIAWGLLPAAIRPSRPLHLPVTVTRGGVIEPAYAEILLNGNVEIRGAGTFAIATVCGMPSQCIIYSLI